MEVRCYDENTWLYPDLIPAPAHKPRLLLARNGHTGLQIWADGEASLLKLAVKLPAGVTVQPYQLLPTHVEANSGPKTLTAERYEDVRDFVTREAPFHVFDITMPLIAEALQDGDAVEVTLRREPLALFFRFAAAATAEPVSGEAVLTLTVGDESTTVAVPLDVTRAVVPGLSREGFGIVNWLQLDDICALHGTEKGSPAFWQLVDAYLENQLELRTNHLMLPGGVPVRDAEGKVTGFDFSLCEEVGRRALAKGFSYVYGGFVAHWVHWDDPNITLLWNREEDIATIEAYRQLKLYFTGLWELVCRMGWQSCWMQCLVDEPQIPNSAAYRILSDICRKCMPGVTIHDPIESWEIPGATDIWCLKQAQFDQYRDTWKQYQAMGEKMWVYTCGFPAGKWMNRSTDLPLLAGRLPFWVCAKEGFEGFLHWGYNAWNKMDPVAYNCFHRPGCMLPPGDGFIVYPGALGPVNSLRAQIQLFGAEDYELLHQLPEETMRGLCDSLFRNFEDYESDPAAFSAVRRSLLNAF